MALSLPNSVLFCLLVVLLSRSDAFVSKQFTMMPQRRPMASMLSSSRSAIARNQIDLQKENWVVLPDMFESLSQQIPTVECLEDSLVTADGTVKLNYQEVNERIKTLAAGLQSKNLRSSESVALFAENSHKWFLLDQAIMKCGAHSAVRGAAAPVKELAYIYQNSDCVGLAVENAKTLKKLLDAGFLGANKTEAPVVAPKFVVVLHGAGQSGPELKKSLLESSVPDAHKQESFLHRTEVLTFDELLERGASCELAAVKRDASATATIVYTSGTTSNPKGVVLSHHNLVSQAKGNAFSREKDGKFNPSIGDSFLSLLPCWHIFERSAEYGMLGRGCRIVYSNLLNFKKDLEEKRPEYLIAVPRLYESLHKTITSQLKSQTGLARRVVDASMAVTGGYTAARDVFKGLVVGDKQPSVVTKFIALLKMVLLWPLWKVADGLVWRGVREKFGGQVKVMVSGGAMLPPHIERFFALTGLYLIAGYGLTETSPVLCNQLVEHKVPGCIGRPFPGVEVKIIDPDTGAEVPLGATGILCVRGPGVMQGYIHDEAATAAVMDAQGYFNTGDLVRVNPATGDLIITGRHKDTIVLSNGENIAPEPIEDGIVGASSLVDQVMLVGQDRRTLKALAVVNVPSLVARGLLPAAQSSKITDALTRLSAARAAEPSPEQQAQVLVLQEEVKAANAQLNEMQSIHKEIHKDIGEVMRGLKPHERVNELILIAEPFSMGNGQLTQTLKVKRHKVLEVYNDLI